MRARITVELKPGVLDPEGKAIEGALHGLGFDDIKGARQGKIIWLDLDGHDQDAARRRVRDMCESLLANTVIEDYQIEILA